MSSVAMKMCDAVTAVQSCDRQPWLLSIRHGAYLPTLMDNKAVVNNHPVLEAGWKLDCVDKRHGGSQCLWLPDGTKVTLEYDANKYKLFVLCRHPTAHKLRTVPIDWVDCHIEDLAIDDGTKPVQGKNCTLEIPIIDSASMIEELEMESTWITQEDAKAKKGEAATSVDNKVVDNREEKKKETAQNAAIFDPNNKINWKLMLGH
eukprot:11326048-Ditylum_brightwellii.AAC.1